MDDEYLSLQRLIDALYAEAHYATRLDAILWAECADLDLQALEIIELMPPGHYIRQQMCDQINSALKGHGWTGTFRTVE